jgi:hypothetical protein
MRFCRDFERGNAFGVNLEKESRRRIVKALRLLSELAQHHIFEMCCYCQFWNNKQCVQIRKEGAKMNVYHNPKAAFCERGNDPKAWNWKDGCEDFKLTEDSSKIASYTRHKKEFGEYVERARLGAKEVSS